MPHNRRQFRIVVERSGQLWHGGKSTPCHVCDLTEQGFLIQTTLDLSKDAIVRLQCDLNTSGSIECLIQLVHVRQPFVGGQIVEISQANRERLMHFVQQVIALNMTGM
jgi:PilZ domain